MELVVDANVLFSALIKDSRTRYILLTSGFVFYAPEFLFEEFEEHLEELSGKTQVDAVQLRELVQTIMLASRIQIVPAAELVSFLGEAQGLAPDQDDIQYFALALKYNCAIWSNDKKLQAQKVIKVYSTQELILAAQR